MLLEPLQGFINCMHYTVHTTVCVGDIIYSLLSNTMYSGVQISERLRDTKYSTYTSSVIPRPLMNQIPWYLVFSSRDKLCDCYVGTAQLLLFSEV